MSPARFRAVAVLVAGAMAFWLPWAVLHLNEGALWLGIPYAAPPVVWALAVPGRRQKAATSTASRSV